MADAFEVDQLLQATFFDLISGGIRSLEASKSLIARLYVPSLQDNLVEWLVGVSADAVGQANSAHRAVIVALSSIPGLCLESALQ